MSKATKDGVVIMFGLSGVGKTRMLTAFAAENDFKYVSASALLKDTKRTIDERPISADELRTGEVVENQKVLLEAFKNIRRNENGRIVLDAHNLVDTDKGIVDIPDDVIAGFTPDIIIFVFDDPEEIQKRREMDPVRNRPQRRESELETQQNRATANAQGSADLLGINCVLIKSGDEERLRKVIFSLYGIVDSRK